VLGDVVRDDEQFEVLAATLRALVATQQPATAAALCQACVQLFGKCVAPAAPMLPSEIIGVLRLARE
jgi:hypothetical protein